MILAFELTNPGRRDEELTSLVTDLGRLRIETCRAKGDVAPIRSIAGSKTLLATPYGIRVDSLGYVYMTDPGAQDVKVYRPGAHGNVAPVQNITSVTHPYGTAIP